MGHRAGDKIAVRINVISAPCGRGIELITGETYDTKPCECSEEVVCGDGMKAFCRSTLCLLL